ncbi:hypothetical protein D3C76_1782170 [compost metagenome]
MGSECLQVRTKPAVCIQCTFTTCKVREYQPFDSRDDTGIVILRNNSRDVASFRQLGCNTRGTAISLTSCLKG